MNFELADEQRRKTRLAHFVKGGLLSRSVGAWISLSAFLLTLGYFTPAQSQVYSTRVVPDENLRLTYPADAEGNRIPDFSHAGYRGGGIALPAVPTVREIEPVPGDNTAHIQSAIQAVSTLPLNDEGFRGALLLRKGRYPVTGTIRVRADGVVLRGEGDDADPNVNTVIVRTGNATTGCFRHRLCKLKA